MAKVLDEFRQRIPGASVVIAGGAARDAQIGRVPKDFDVFALGTSAEALTGAARLSDLERVESNLEWHKSEPGLVATVRWREVEVQVIASACASLPDLLDTFDWSVSLYGFDGAIVAHPLAALPVHGEHLKLNRVTYPYSTMRRGYRFSERYGMRLRPLDVRRIAEHFTSVDGAASA